MASMLSKSHALRLNRLGRLGGWQFAISLGWAAAGLSDACAADRIRVAALKTGTLTWECVMGWAFDITVPSPRTVSTPHRSGEYNQGADHDHHNCKLKKLTELHLRPDTALPLSANRR